jgi:hypothetical protein
MPSSPIDQDLDRQIHTTHERLFRAMEARLPALASDTKERYFGVLSLLVGKLEADDKPLREIVQEVVTEAAGIILQEMQGS